MAKYMQGIAARAKASGDAQKVPIPNLLAASSEFRVEKDGPMTLEQMARAQENILNMSDDDKPKAQLKPETIAGLRALHEEVEKQNKVVEATTPPAPPAEEVAPVEEKPKKAVIPMSKEEQRELNNTSDLDFDLAVSRMRSDVINNVEERKAVEARLKPMDLSDGILTGEWRQTVPISPDKLVVIFRSITPLENEEIRRHVLEKILVNDDERFTAIESERYGFMQTVAAVHSLNGQELPKHLKTGEKGGRKFDWAVFEKKVNLFMAYPTPLIHALGTHAYWFDLRVRGLFSNQALKNG